MKVDVIIPAHNPGSYLREALNSVMAQTYRDWHIYVIDDASEESFEELVSAQNGIVEPSSDDILTLWSNGGREVFFEKFIIFSIENSDKTADR